MRSMLLSSILLLLLVARAGGATAQPPSTGPTPRPSAAARASAAQASTAQPADARSSDPHALDLDRAIADGPALTVDEATARALRTAPSIAQARALVRASEAAIARTWAALLPRLELSAQYMRVDGFRDGEITTSVDPAALDAARMLAQQVTDPASRALWLNTLNAQANTSMAIVIPRNRFGVGARLQWPVSDLFFSILPAVQAAEAGSRASAIQLEVQRAEVRFQAQQAYYALARARGALAVAEEAARLTAAQLEQISAGVRAGFLTTADELLARARLADRQQTVATARAGVEIADAALRVLMGAPRGPVFGLQALDAKASPETRSAEALVAHALATRPELRAFEASLEARRAAIRANDATGYPHLAIVAAADYANPNRYQIPPQAVFTPSWEVGAALIWSPNDLWTSAQRGRELRAELDGVQAQRAQLERGIQLEVRQAHAELRAAMEAIETSRLSLEAANAAYESRLVQLRAGRATTADLFAAEAQLDAARLSVLGARVSVHVLRARLERTLGTPTTDPR